MSGATRTRPVLPRVAGVSWRALLLIVVIACTAGAGGAWWVLGHYALQLRMSDQPMTIRLPESMPVQVDLLGKDGGTGSLPLQLDDALDVMVSIGTLVPLHMNVPFRKTVPIKGMMPLDTTIQTRLLGFPVTLPVKGMVPVDFELPLDMTIPINQRVRVRFKAPVKARIRQQLQIPLPDNQPMQIRFDDNTLPITLQSGKLLLPFSGMGLKRPH